MVGMTFFAILGTISYMLSFVRLQTIQSQRNHGQAFYAAESGVQDFVTTLRQNGSIVTNYGMTDQGGQPQVFTHAAGVFDHNICSDGTVTTTSMCGTSPNLTNPMGSYYVSSVTKYVKNQYNPWDMYVVSIIGGNFVTTGTRATQEIRIVVRGRNPGSVFISTLGSWFFPSSGASYSVTPGSTITGEIMATSFVVPAGFSFTVPANLVLYYTNHATGTFSCADGGTTCVQQWAQQSYSGVDISYIQSLAPGVLPSVTPVSVSSATVPTVAGVIYVDGNIEIAPDTAFTSAVTVAATGDIKIKGNLNAAGTYPLSLVAGGSIIIDVPTSTATSVTISKTFVNANTAFKTTQTTSGVLGTLSFTGSISIRGDIGSNSVINTSAFQTRSYIFDPNIQSVSLPGITYMADVVEYVVP